MSNYQRILVDRLTSDPAFVFDFARRFRPVPPIVPGSIAKRRAQVFGLDAPPGPGVRTSWLVTANTRPEAKPPPEGEPWPTRWGVLIDAFVDERGAPIREFPPDLLLGWPLLHATLRNSFGAPITHIALCPSFELANAINQIFAIEPELMPIVVTAGTYDDLPADVRARLQVHVPTRGSGKGGVAMN
ncbi:MAG: hypothetical protein HC927_12265 [Deltaproteobacteria bacterium]|nr:hypothetical protein [Deltaproteobacteria bacterium]